MKKRNLLLVLLGCGVFMTACVSSSGIRSETEEQSENVTQESVTEANGESDAYFCPTQLCAAAARLEDTVYYLGNSVTNEDGDEGCYLYTMDGEEQDWLSYAGYGRGIYADMEELYLLAHDDENWYLEQWDSPEVSFYLDAYDTEDAAFSVMPERVRVYQGYIYLLCDPEGQKDLSCFTLKRISLSTGAAETVFEAGDEACIYDNLVFNGNYIAFFVRDIVIGGANSREENFIKVYDLSTLTEVNSAVSGCYHFALDSAGAIYYGSRDDGYACLKIKAVSENEKILYRTGIPYGKWETFCGYFDVFMDANYIYLDNRTLYEYFDTGEFSGRSITVVDYEGNAVGEWELDGVLSRDEYAVSSVIYQDENMLMFSVQDMEQRFKGIIYKTDVFETEQSWQRLEDSAVDREKFPIEFTDKAASSVVYSSMDGCSEVLPVDISTDKGNYSVEITYYYDTAGINYRGWSEVLIQYCSLEITDLGDFELLDSWQYNGQKDRDGLAAYEWHQPERFYLLRAQDGSQIVVRYIYSMKTGWIAARGGEEYSSSPGVEIECWQLEDIS